MEQLIKYIYCLFAVFFFFVFVKLPSDACIHSNQIWNIESFNKQVFSLSEYIYFQCAHNMCVWAIEELFKVTFSLIFLHQSQKLCIVFYLCIFFILNDDDDDDGKKRPRDVGYTIKTTNSNVQ